MAIGCLTAMVGCQSDSGVKGFALKNPFASSEPASPARNVAKPADVAKSADVAKPGEADQGKRRTPVVRTDAKPPEREANVAARDVKRKETEKPGAADFAPEMTRAKNLEHGGRFQEARAVYERLIVRYPDRYEPYHRLGVVADREGRFSDAQALFDQAIRLNPTNPDLHNDMGYCLYLQGKFDQAEAAVIHAIQINATNPRYYNNLGMIYGHQRRYDEALEQFRRGGSEADAYYNLAFMLAAREDTEGAKKYFRLALRADPGYAEARQALDALDRAPENRQESKPLATANVVASGLYPDTGVQVPGRYNAQPASLTVPVTPTLGSDQRDPALIR